jgi:quinol monooxygenase YgiN
MLTFSLAEFPIPQVKENEDMDKCALLVMLRARAGKEEDVEKFLISAGPLVLREIGTTSWYAIKLGSARFGIFDTFADDAARDAHLNGEVARLLFANAEELFAEPPVVESLDILSAKAPAGES